MVCCVVAVAAERLPTAGKLPARKRTYSKKHTLLDGFEAIRCELRQ